jgi:putative transposase
VPRTRRPYPEEFRREAIKLALLGDKPQRKLAKDLGISEVTLRKRLRQEKAERGERPDGLSGDEREELARLRDENAKLRMERDRLESSRLLREGERRAVGEVLSLIAAEKADYPVAVMCRTFGVNRTRFHDWERRAPSDRALSDAFLTERIKQIHGDSRGVYGSPRIQAELRLEHGIRVGRKRVARLMKAAGISGSHRVNGGGQRSGSRGSRPTCAQPWSSTRSRWRSRARRPGPGLIHHSDSDSQHVSLAFGRAACEAGIAVSMGSRGDAYDNAVAERSSRPSRRSSCTGAHGRRGLSSSQPCSIKLLHRGVL